jgi:hypothetical protein
MPIEPSHLTALEKLLDQMHRLMTEYIALHEDGKNTELIFEKAKELEHIHQIIRSKMND